MYLIFFSEGFENDIAGIPIFYCRAILDSIKQQLRYEPAKPTKRRKILKGLLPPWNAVPPIWELRVRNFRVFYDISEEEETVYIRAIRKKPPGKAAEEIV